MGMDPGFPNAADFKEEDKKEFIRTWKFKRGPGLGGMNIGEDFLVPQGYVVVDYETHVKSRYNTKGDPDIRLVFRENDTSVLRVPIGVHNGIRLTPEGITGAGAGYTGEFKIIAVPQAQWFKFMIDKLSNDI